ncbi:peroxisomal sarcosine oxidase-like [Penaeus japonicus]|uniref:peroxisomal sarcosine oxidase-like n=1 Tax=Penaeus japonicus TaxID=27405 RepID=UPI001C70F574|nr:peroxisomal sarcosine oxidase-like [Penaeus japonicus]
MLDISQEPGKMGKDSFDVAVIGGGIMGSCAAYSLAKAGKSTVLIDKYALPHFKGSSGGFSRITRRANFGIPELTPIMDDSFRLWEEISQKAHEELINPAPMLVVGKDRQAVSKMAESVEATGYKPVWLSVQQTNSKYKSKFTDDYYIFEDPTAGVLKADRCLIAVQKLFREVGGRVLDGWPVVGVEAGEPWTKISGPRGVVKARWLVLCPGPWANHVLQHLGVYLPLRSVRTTSMYCRNEQFPLSSFVDCTTGSYFYALPAMEHPGHIKMGLHDGVEMDPNQSHEVDLAGLRQKSLSYFKAFFPDLAEQYAFEQLCYYTLTPDEEFILDRHPRHRNIMYAVGFSGTGFKIAPVIGEVLTSMVQGKAPKHDVSAFSAERFKKSTAVKSKY